MLWNVGNRVVASLFLFTFVLFFASSFAACGGNDLELDRRHGPAFAPVDWFSGRQTGVLLVRDRNGNLRESAHIARDCGPLSGTQKGNCTDKIRYGYGPSRNHTSKLSWRLYHPDRSKAVLEYQDERGSFTASIEGRSAIASATRLLEDASKKSASCLVKFTILPGSPPMLLQSERCSYFGIFIGEIQVLWKKES